MTVPRLAAGLTAALAMIVLGGCEPKRENRVAIANGWRDRVAVSIHERHAGEYQFLDLGPGQEGSFAKLAPGTYDLAFDPACGSSCTAYRAARSLTFDACCGSKSYAVGSAGQVSE